MEDFDPIENMALLRGDRTQDEMAEMMGISQASLSLIERRRRNPTLKQAIQIRKFYGIPVRLWGDDDTTEDG